MALNKCIRKLSSLNRVILCEQYVCIDQQSTNALNNPCSLSFYFLYHLSVSEVPNTSTNTGVFSNIGVQPRIILSDLSNKSYIQSDSQELWYNNSDNYINIKPCQVKLSDIFQQDPLASHCHISKCGNKKCKTCDVLNTGSSFTSSLTKKSYCTRSFDDINCKSSNLIYGITCSHCGLIYVGETKGQLNKRISSHRFQIVHNGKQLIYQHFDLPNHSILSMGVIVIEKIYHHTDSPNLSTHYRREQEEFWIKVSMDAMTTCLA